MMTVQGFMREHRRRTGERRIEAWLEGRRYCLLQGDQSIANQAGAAFRSDLNAELQALVTLSSGTSAPGTTYAHQLWADTTNNVLKKRNAANSAWLVVRTLDETFVLSRSSNTILGLSDVGKTLVATAAFTQTLTAAATLGDGWWVALNAQGNAIVLDANGSELIDGATTKTVTGSGFLFCNGSAFFTVGFVSSVLTLNGCINGGCRVLAGGNVSLSTTPQYGPVDMWAAWASGGAVSAGTITQGSSAIGSYAKYLLLQTVTLTGSGVLSVRQRIASADAAFWNGKVCSFACKVLQDTGGAINYTVVVRKPTAADNYASTSVISTSSAVSVPNNTTTLVSSLAIAMGDCSNGIEIEIQATTGAISTKNFVVTDMVLTEGTAAADFPQTPIGDDIARCGFYYEKSYDLATAPAAATDVGMVCLGQGANASSQQNGCEIRWRWTKRAAGTLSLWDRAGTSNKFTARSNASYSDNVGSPSAVAAGTRNAIVDSGYTTGAHIFVHYAIDARL